MNNQPIVIIGHQGKTGSRVQQRLSKLGLVTRGVSRSTTPSFDWERPETWPNALQGTCAMYVTYQPDLAVPGALDAINKLTQVAKTEGIKHMVLLSGRGETGAQKAEQVLINSGLSWNVVRASWFMQNFSESFLLESIQAGHLSLPADKVLEPFVDADDIADVAVAALTRPELHNRVFEVTGPRAMTFGECVAEISKACGRPIEYAPVSLDDFLQALESEGVPEGYRWLMNELFGKVLDGRNTATTDGVLQALNRQPVSFSDYVAKTLPTGVWDLHAHKATT